MTSGGSVELAGERPMVLLPTTTCEPKGARLIGVPDTVTAGAPGTIIWLPTTNCDAELAVTG